VKQLKYTRSFLFISAIIIAVIICHFNGDVWEEKIRTVLYTIKRDSVPSFATEMTDAKGVPYVYYAPQNGIAAGTQYNATIVANYAINYYNNFSETKDSTQLDKFINCVHFLQDSVTTKYNAGFYIFNWQQPWYPNVKAPFTSGMTSGRAIEVFVDAFKLYKDSAYLKQAKSLLRGFYIPIQYDGFTYMQTEGWWYEEIAHKNVVTPHILDGHIFAILGVQKLYKQTHDDSALFIVQKGLAALKYQLPLSNAGDGKIYYDIHKKVADKKYQKILTGQMQQLWLTTNDSTFLSYYKKWNAPMQQDYMLRVVKEKNISGMVLFVIIFLITGLFLFILNRIVIKLNN
jgi:hypothetical protein